MWLCNYKNSKRKVNSCKSHYPKNTLRLLLNLRIGSHPALLLRHFTMRHFWSLVPLLVSGGTIGAWWHYWCLVPLLVPGGTIGPWCHYWSLVAPAFWFYSTQCHSSGSKMLLQYKSHNWDTLFPQIICGGLPQCFNRVQCSNPTHVPRRPCSYIFYEQGASGRVA